MGTRHIIAVVLNKKVKVAQYGQWDGYPTGQGYIIADFFEQLDTTAKFNKFKDAVDDCKFITQKTFHNMWTKAGADPESAFVSLKVSNRFGKMYPQFRRNTGANVLQLILDGKRELQNEIDFVKSGLFCEWAYVIDLDKKVIEVYKGFVKRKLTKKDGRFYKLKGQDGYSPVALIATYDLKDNLHEKMRELEESLKE